MKQFLIIMMIFSSGLVFGQGNDQLEIKLYKNTHEIEESFDIYLINKDTVILKDIQNLKKSDLNNYSIRICYGKHRVLVSQTEEKVYYIHVYLDKRSYKNNLDETGFGIGNLFKKYYYIDLGLDFMQRISRSKRKYCKVPV